MTRFIELFGRLRSRLAPRGVSMLQVSRVATAIPEVPILQNSGFPDRFGPFKKRVARKEQKGDEKPESNDATADKPKESVTNASEANEQKESDPNENEEQPRGSRMPGISGLLAFCMGLGVIDMLMRANRGLELTVQEFISELLLKGLVKKVEISSDGVARVFVTGEAPDEYKGRRVYIQLPSIEQFEAKLDYIQNRLGLDPSQHVRIRYHDGFFLKNKESIDGLLGTMVSIGILLFALRAVRSGFRSDMGGGRFPGLPGSSKSFFKQFNLRPPGSDKTGSSSTKPSSGGSKSGSATQGSDSEAGGGLFGMLRDSLKRGGPFGGGFSSFEKKLSRGDGASADGATQSTTKFQDVAGLTQAKIEVAEFVDFLKAPKKYVDLGARLPRGALLVGPPGTGKTLLARAIAGEAQVPFFSMSGSDFVELFVGVGASRVRELFAKARENAPSIIFVDEIDAIGRSRASGKSARNGADSEREATLNQLLVELDGFDSGVASTSGDKTANKPVIVFAGTNRMDVLDKALLRPGRFDRHIDIDVPDIADREEIFRLYLKKLKLTASLTVEEMSKRLAALTPGFVGADIRNVVNEAAILAARENASEVVGRHFELATERILGGLAKENKAFSKAEQVSVATHESGHAVASWFLEYADPLLKVSIVPRSKGALGYAQYLPSEVGLLTKEALLDKMCTVLGGRAAEEVFLKAVTTGAADDFRKVTAYAYQMVTAYGMSEHLGMIDWEYGSGKSGGNGGLYKPMSEKTSEMIDFEVKRLVDEQYKRCKALLESKRDLVEKLRDLLLSKQTVTYPDIKSVLGPRQWAIKKEYSQYVETSGEGVSPPAGAEPVGQTCEVKGKNQNAKESKSQSGSGSTRLEPETVTSSVVKSLD